MPKLSVICLSLLFAAQLTTTVATASEHVSIQHYQAPQARGLKISDFSGELIIKRSDKMGVRLNLTGSKRQLDQLNLSTHGTVFRLQMSGEHSSQSTSTVLSNIVAIATNGSNTQLIINGQEVSAEAQPPLQAEFSVHPAVSLTLQGISGEAAIESRSGPVDAELRAGRLSFAALRDARLQIKGSGRINVDKAQGRLETIIKGSGTLRVQNARLDGLLAQVLGTGDIRIHGQAEQAELQLRGVGTIVVDTVRQRPRVSLNGVGTITVGNW